MFLKKPPSHSWWFDSHNSPRRSPWLQSTLTELDEKTKAMLKLVEEDADSFAQRAEMYYKKRPELVNMVEDFYRTHRSLAERYDQLRSEAGPRLTLTPSISPFSAKNQSQKLGTQSDRSSSRSSIASSDCFDSEESEVDDPDEEETQVGGGDVEEVSSKDGEVKKMRGEIDRLKEENRIQKAEMMERNEEKREAIRQLCLAMDILKEENVSLRKCLEDSKKRGVFEFSKWKGVFSGKFFSGR
ncbi:protein NETWORKED 3C-like [Magnolia sinica]|uniref:protein NETWORKED 3C-like n=1 Tax=Magnolia sinica TaxID=86752 RepID=UPI00265A1C06|nr:protein NETWORKED 3C-like [Magnolia sinica]XP_058082578.1 protein NETWORKED 3C-like [Magnolia sinica]